jgi:CBS-domain-containing membrane protein
MKKFALPLIAGLGASVTIGFLLYLGVTLSNTTLIMAPFGATAVLVFGLPQSPLAQPKNVILGHLITAFIGVFFVEFVGVSQIDLAVATGLGVSGMLLTKTTHPPAGANPLLIMMSGQTWLFLVTPVLIGAVIIVLMGKIMQLFQARFMVKC